MTDIPTLIGIAEAAKKEAPFGFVKPPEGCGFDDICIPEESPDQPLYGTLLCGEYYEGCVISEFQVTFDPPTVLALLQRLYELEQKARRAEHPRTPFDKETP